MRKVEIHCCRLTEELRTRAFPSPILFTLLELPEGNGLLWAEVTFPSGLLCCLSWDSQLLQCGQACAGKQLGAYLSLIR